VLVAPAAVDFVLAAPAVLASATASEHASTNDKNPDKYRPISHSFLAVTGCWNCLITVTADTQPEIRRRFKDLSTVGSHLQWRRTQER
jgi:hypothetical protein